MADFIHVGAMALLLSALVALAPHVANAAPACSLQQAGLEKEEADLPRVELANTTDWQNTCITLEVNMDFAARMAAHAARCPQSVQPAKASAWVAQGDRDSAMFAKRKCKHTF